MADDIDTSADASPGEFTVTLIDEANPTVDGRVFEPGRVTWREPPLPLMYLTENIGDGHKGSKVGASITEIWRDGDKIKARGVFDSGENGQELRRLISEGTLNGVSADVGGAILEQELSDDGVNMARIMQGKIMGATVLPFPAFDDTRIAVVASAVPTEPPSAWFKNPNLKAPTPLTITRDGQVFGHAAVWGTCHTGRPGTCLTPPRSGSDYAYFRTGAVLTADGDTVATGPITLGTGHAGLTLSSKTAAEHYDHTGTAIADVATGEDAFGIWMAGAVRPDVTDERVRALRASAISGDWRSVNGQLELVALLAVNTPGFPVPRTNVSFADESEPLALVAAGVVEIGIDNLEFAKNDEDTTDKKGKKMSDQSCGCQHTDTEEVIGTETEEFKAWIEKRAKELDAEDQLPPDWKKSKQDLTARIDALETAIISLAAARIQTFGDVDGHPFRGNQYSKGGGSDKEESKSSPDKLKKEKSALPEDKKTAERDRIRKDYGVTISRDGKTATVKGLEWGTEVERKTGNGWEYTSLTNAEAKFNAQGLADKYDVTVTGVKDGYGGKEISVKGDPENVDKFLSAYENNDLGFGKFPAGVRAVKY